MLRRLSIPCRRGMLTLVALSIWSGTVWAQGYDLRGDHLAVDRQSHWQAWNFASGTIEIGPQGLVQPHFVAKNTNAVEDIVFHLQHNPPGGKSAEDVSLQDAIAAGTNAAEVIHVLDGDESTYWEPDADRPRSDWWFQVDLGRLVSAQRIVLRFAAAGDGDPFLQFLVLVSDGDLTSSKDVKFNQVFRTLKNSKNERLFEIDLEPSQLNDDAAFDNDLVRFVQVVITESDSTRAALVSESEHAGLDPADRGAVDYYKKVADGEVQVSQATYESQEVQDRGAIRHYRRERPRLAELEVWAEGENIGLGLADRKGVALDFRGNSARVLVDGLFDTFLNIQTAIDGTVRTLFFDLQGFYWLDTHHVTYSDEGQGQRQRWGSYDLQTSDGTRAPDGTLVWNVQSSLHNRTATSTLFLYDADVFEPVKARYVQFTFWDVPGRSSVAIPREMQFYGEGFQPEVELTSPLLRLGTEQNLKSIEWDADIRPGTVIEIQTRTGNQLAEEFRYFDKGGKEVSPEAYSKLSFFTKGEIDTLEVAGADWSPWSAPYEASGAVISSPSPRQYLLLRARLLSEDPMLAAGLSAIRVNFAAPLARQILGELEPGTVEELGTKQDLSLFIRPIGQTQSFDEILVRGPGGMQLAFQELRVGREADWQSGAIRALGGVQVVSTAPDSLWLRLDEPVQPNTADLIEVRFQTALYLPGAQFHAAIGDSATEDSWQRIDAPSERQDATELATSQSLVLRGPSGGERVLSAVTISPGVLTPNGDGINDHADFIFNVSRLTGSKAVDIRIYDLSGRQVHGWSEQRPRVSGAYTVPWNGQDGSGRVVPPGIYILEIGVDTDSDSRVRNTMARRVLQVAY